MLFTVWHEKIVLFKKKKKNLFKTVLDAVSKWLIKQQQQQQISNLCEVQIFQKCANFDRLLYIYLLRIKMILQTFKISISNGSISAEHQYFTINFTLKLFHVSVTVANTGSLK